MRQQVSSEVRENVEAREHPVQHERGTGRRPPADGVEPGGEEKVSDVLVPHHGRVDPRERLAVLEVQSLEHHHVGEENGEEAVAVGGGGKNRHQCEPQRQDVAHEPPESSGAGQGGQLSEKQPVRHEKMSWWT